MTYEHVVFSIEYVFTKFIWLHTRCYPSQGIVSTSIIILGKSIRLPQPWSARSSIELWEKFCLKNRRSFPSKRILVGESRVLIEL